MITKDNTLSQQNSKSIDPRSNTGSNSPKHVECNDYATARIDHVSLLWTKNGSQDILLPLTRYLGIVFDLSNPIGRKIGVWWDRNYSSACGCILSEREGDNGRVHVRLSISGEACGRVSSLRLKSFLSWCDRSLVGLTCSRLDLAIDDFSKRLKLEDLEDACKNGNYSGFRECKTTTNYGKKHGGWTVNLGARSGEKYVRIYDKFAQSKGEIDSIRFEAEVSGKLSDRLLSLLIECPNNEREYQSILIDYAVGTIDFIDKVDKNLSRNTQLSWWYEWLVFLKSCPKKLHVRRFKTSIVVKKRWVDRAVSKALALLQDALGQVDMKRYLDLIISDARARYTEMDELLLSDYRKVNDYIDRGYDIVSV